MKFFYKNIYSNLLQHKFLNPPHFFKNSVSLEIKYENLESLNDESILKSFYFFFLVFNVFPSFKDFNSRFHLGKTFYKFQIFYKFNSLYADLFLLNSFFNSLSEANKVSFDSKIYYNNLGLVLNDLKSFASIESNPHFFRWEKDLFLNCSPCGLRNIKSLNLYFFFIENFKNYNYNNIWLYVI